jgi:cell division protease FtsH
MVCDWGMSSLGPLAFGENADHIFLGRDITRTQNYGEKTADSIDGEIAAIVDCECSRARKILEERRSELDNLAKRLLDEETVDGAAVYALVGREVKVDKPEPEETRKVKPSGRKQKPNTQAADRDEKS